MSNFRVLIASPMRASDPLCAQVTYGYARVLRQYARDLEVDVMDPREMLDPEDMDDVAYGPDLTRVRSRIVRMALESERQYTHVWWWDTDIIPWDSAIAAYMLMTGKDIVGAPYPRKKIRWDALAKYVAKQHAAGRVPTPDELEYNAIDFPRVETPAEQQGQVVETRYIGMGCMTTSITALRKMVEYWGPRGLTFGDVVNGQRFRTVGIFKLAFPEERGEGPDDPLCSEDYSFCWRARQAGIPVYTYVGNGAPLDHAGAYVYRARLG